MVKAELGEAVWAEGEEDLLGPHHRAVGHLDTCVDATCVDATWYR